MGSKKPLEKVRLQGCVRGISLPSDLKNNYIEKQVKSQAELLTITKIILGSFSIWH